MSFGYQVLGFGAFPNREADYFIENAIMLDGGADYLFRKPFTAGNRKTFTFSCWLKRSALGSQGGTTGNNIFGGDRTSSFSDRIMFGSADDGNDWLETSYHDGSSGLVKTSALFRDPTAWTNIVWVVDTDQGGSYSASNTVKIYVNGSLATLNSPSYPAEDYQTAINNTENQTIGVRPGTLTQQHFGGYLAEVILLDGTAESDASKFGELDDNGVWVPIEPTGLTFGTNGFHLKFDEAGLLGKSSNSTTNPTVSFLGSQVFSSAAQTFTVSDATLGDAASNRSIVIAAGGARSNAGNRTATCTVGGSSATEIVRSFSGKPNCLYFFIIDVPTGTEADIVVTFSGGNNNMDAAGIAWWRVLDAGQPISISTANADGWSSIGTTNIGQNGDTTLYGLFDSGSATGFNWSGATERADHPNMTSASAPSTFYGFTAADYAYSSGESHTETVSTASGSGNETSYAGVTFSNNNSFTTNSIAAANKVTDTCTDDAESVGNFATLSSIDQVQGASVLSNGNLTIVGSGSNHSSTRSTLQTDGSGKFAWEVTVTTHDTNTVIGLMKSSDITSGGNLIGNQTNSGWALIADPGSTNNAKSRFNNSDMVADLGAAMTNGDIYHLELNNATGDVFAWRKPSGGTFAALNSGNTITAGAGKTALAGTPVLFAQHTYQAAATNSQTYNFGQTTFEQTPSSGYKAVNTANLAAPTVTSPGDFFKVITYEGAVVDSSSRHTASAVTLPDNTNTTFTVGGQTGSLAQIIDNNSSTAGIRITGAGGELSFDLGSAKAVGAVGMFMDNGGGNSQACTWSVLYSDNNSDFTDTSQDVAYSDNGESSTTEVIKTFSGSHGTHRYWKLRVESKTSETASSGGIYGINLYSANAREITGVGFQPDFVWIKNRDATDNYMLFDSVRGATKDLHSNTADTEATTAESLKSFDTGGFTLGTDDQVNTSSESYVAWCWKAGTSWSEDAQNSNILASSGKKSSTAKFSIATWEHRGGSDGNYAIKHNLGTTPEFFITKSVDQSTNWSCWHKDLVDTAKRIVLSTNAAEASSYWADASDSADGTGSYANISSGESPVTSTLFAIQDDEAGAGTFIGYFFARTPGAIAIGKYAGNASADGPYVVVDDGGSGFKPAWVMIKNISQAGNWFIYDNQRNPYNVVNAYLIADDSATEATSGPVQLDFTANGFKIRSTNDGTNGAPSGTPDTLVYLAFAEHPFGGSGVAQARAR